MVIPTGNNAPAPSPCSARKAINCAIECAAPDSAEPIRNNPIPPKKAGRRPVRSAILPQIGVIIVEDKMYATATQE